MASQETEKQPTIADAIKELALTKGIDKDALVATMEEAFLKAAHSAFGDLRELEARYNEQKGTIDLFLYMTVVEEVDDPERELDLAQARRVDPEAAVGEQLGFQIFWSPADAAKAREEDAKFGDVLDIKQARSAFGRIIAQTAKQVLVQKVRDAERDLIFEEYKDRIGQLVTGIVRRFEKGHNIIVELGERGGGRLPPTEGVIPAREQTPRENYRPGDRISVYVKNIDREARGPMIILSRAAPKLVEKLFQREVPEMDEGIVRIEAVSREAGARSKIAVSSRDSDVDPVGACVGVKGSRVQAVVQELRGEKIDIVPFDPDPARYIINAIQPAEVNKVIVDEADHRMELVVPDEKLSLAIGRKGQNVRLASQLTGWKIDIISDSKFQQMEEESLAVLRAIDGIDDELAREMYRLGFRALEEVAEAAIDELISIPGVGDAERAEKLRSQVESSMERTRRERIQAAIEQVEPLTERDRLRFIRGLGARSIQLIEEAGYRSVEDVAREDPDRLAIRTGLGVKKARIAQQGAQAFLSGEIQEIEQARANRQSELSQPAAGSEG